MLFTSIRITSFLHQTLLVLNLSKINSKKSIDNLSISRLEFCTFDKNEDVIYNFIVFWRTHI